MKFFPLNIMAPRKSSKLFGCSNPFLKYLRSLLHDFWSSILWYNFSWSRDHYQCWYSCHWILLKWWSFTDYNSWCYWPSRYNDLLNEIFGSVFIWLCLVIEFHLLEVLGEDGVVLDSEPVPVTLLHVDHLILGSLVTGHKHYLEWLPSSSQIRVELSENWSEQSEELNEFENGIFDQPAGWTPVCWEIKCDDFLVHESFISCHHHLILPQQLLTCQWVHHNNVLSWLWERREVSGLTTCCSWTRPAPCAEELSERGESSTRKEMLKCI